MWKVLLALVCLVILVVPSVTWWVTQRPVPVLEGIGSVNGLSKPALVRYDGRAIPYVKAETDEDVYAAQGYVVARERMFQMDMLRRAAEGRFSQVYGISALLTDRMNRTIGFERLAKEELKSLTPQARNALQAYCRGVNAYLTENDDKLSVEFTALGYKPAPWREIDTLAVMKYLAYELDESWKLDELRWRITTQVGDNMAAKLFEDNYSVSSWSPDLAISGVAKSTLIRAAAQPIKQAGADSSPLPSPGAPSTAAPAGAPARGTVLRTPGRVLNPSNSRMMGPSGSTQNTAPNVVPSTSSPQTLGPDHSPLRISSLSGAQSNAAVSYSRSSRGTASNLAKRALPTVSAGLGQGIHQLAAQPPFFRKPDRTWGSTNWVLSPAYSKSGGVMLACDKHSALTFPCEFFLISLSSANLHVAGATLPGVPGVVFGRNDRICWSSSSMHADVQDLFVEHFTSEVENKYKSTSKIETAQEFREAIPVRFGADVEHKVTITRHGPVLFRDKDSGISLNWSGYETKKPWLNTICAINRSTDWNDFLKNLSIYGGPPQLFVYGDKSGHIGCHAAGDVPVRAGGGQGTTMTEGWNTTGDWVSMVDFTELPQTFIPAGSAPRPSGDFCIAAGQKIYSIPATASRYGQLWGHQWDSPYRADRLALSLPKGKNGQKLDLLDFSAYQGDQLQMLAKLVVDELKKAMDASKSIDASQTKAMELMQHWDLIVKEDSAAASCFESYVGTLARRILEPKLGKQTTDEYFQHWPLWTTLVEHYLRTKDKDLTPTEERIPDTFLITTFAKSNTRLKQYFNSEDVKDWLWGKAHLANFKLVGMYDGAKWLHNLLDIKGVQVGGDSNCLNACDIDRTIQSGPFQAKNGPTVRLLIDLADDDTFYGNLALGQSGHYSSPFKQDQLKSWLQANPLPIAFSEAQVEKQCRQKFYLSAPGSR